MNRAEKEKSHCKPFYLFIFFNMHLCISSSTTSYSVNPTNSKAKVGSEEGRCRQPYLYPVGIERLLLVRPPARL
ncbi:hypothetical protein Hanom_Chr16g01450761 [Helianthus anomalus]